MLNIQAFGVRLLFGEANYDIPVIDNRIILVGYNGAGKSTLLNSFYYFISAQWVKLREIDFQSIYIVVDGTEFSLSREQIVTYLDERRGLSKTRISRTYIERAYSLLSPAEIQRLATGNPSLTELREAAARVGLPSSAYRELQRMLAAEYTAEYSELAEHVRTIEAVIGDSLGGRILFLPTYRRIEKDLKLIFPEIEEEIQEALVHRSSERARSSVYVELVNFGMEDVSNKITQRMGFLRSQALSQVSNLTNVYLRDVIRNEAHRYSDDIAERINYVSLDRLFPNVEGAILTQSDKTAVSQVVTKIKNGMNLSDNERYVAHYVSYLIDIGKRMAELEGPVHEFVDTCNRYLFGKKFIFDTSAYEMRIEGQSGRAIPLESLSSGEKQIVSLFSHLMLDNQDTNYIIIDEPELSLSVDWQRRFLSDISKLPSCKLLAAVTHSPFIFDNELDRYTVDVIERRNDDLP